MVRNVTALFLLFLIFLLTGCVQLTKEQRDDVTKLNKASAGLGVRIETLEPVLQGLWDKMKEVAAAVARGELPKEEGAKLIEALRKERDPLQKEYAAATVEIKTILAKVTAINDSGVPWYQQLWLLLPAALGLAGTVLKSRQVTALGATLAETQGHLDTTVLAVKSYMGPEAPDNHQLKKALRKKAAESGDKREFDAVVRGILTRAA